jgi:putative transposase
MQSRTDKELVIGALLLAIWKRKPNQSVMVHSDQGSHFSSDEWQGFLKEHNLVASMSRRGNCHDNAVVESFFQLLKRERIKRRTFLNREQARLDVFYYIKMVHNPIRRHGHNDGLSPVKYKQQFTRRLASV